MSKVIDEYREGIKIILEDNTILKIFIYLNPRNDSLNYLNTPCTSK